MAPYQFVEHAATSLDGSLLVRVVLLLQSTQHTVLSVIQNIISHHIINVRLGLGGANMNIRANGQESAVRVRGAPIHSHAAYDQF